MQNENQQEMERSIRAFVDRVKTEHPGTMCALTKPGFVECDAQEQTLILSYPAQSWEANTRGRMQGGVIASLLDFTGGCLAMYCSGAMVLTVSLQTSYLRPGPTEGKVLVKARMTKTGRTMLHVYAECWSEDAPGKLIATGNMVYIRG
ncbi:MAG: PaaI family thioesterase [Butyricicoccus sp.]|nr:PaaI family thioesterase [Butyricicoccus sp.]